MERLVRDVFRLFGNRVDCHLGWHDKWVFKRQPLTALLVQNALEGNAYPRCASSIRNGHESLDLSRCRRRYPDSTIAETGQVTACSVATLRALVAGVDISGSFIERFPGSRRIPKDCAWLHLSDSIRSRSIRSMVEPPCGQIAGNRASETGNASIRSSIRIPESCWNSRLSLAAWCAV